MAKILGLKSARAIVARLLFAVHSLLAIGCLVERGCPLLVKPELNWIFWSLAAIPFLLFLEGALTVLIRGGDEYKWFCPCVFIFLCGSVPPIWFLEMTTTHGASIRASQNLTSIRATQNFTTTSTTISRSAVPVETSLAAAFDELNTTQMTEDEFFANGTVNYDQGLDEEDMEIIKVVKRIKVMLPLLPWWSEELWVQLIEQTLLIVLIVGRWLLPKGQITRDQLSQLLLAYLAISADIVELFSIFVDVSEVRRNMQLTIILLTIWSISLIQFFMVLTTVKGQKARYCFKESITNPVIIDLVERDAAICRSISNSSINRSVKDANVGLRNKSIDMLSSRCRSPKAPVRKITAASISRRPTTTCKDKICSVSVWGILFTVVLQDGPFLALRLYLIVLYGKASYTMFFFVCKNTLIILVQLYRLLVICIENPKNMGNTGLLIDGAMELDGESMTSGSKLTSPKLV